MEKSIAQSAFPKIASNQKNQQRHIEEHHKILNKCCPPESLTMKTFEFLVKCQMFINYFL